MVGVAQKLFYEQLGALENSDGVLKGDREVVFDVLRILTSKYSDASSSVWAFDHDGITDILGFYFGFVYIGQFFGTL